VQQRILWKINAKQQLITLEQKRAQPVLQQPQQLASTTVEEFPSPNNSVSLHEENVDNFSLNESDDDVLVDLVIENYQTPQEPTAVVEQKQQLNDQTSEQQIVDQLLEEKLEEKQSVFNQESISSEVKFIY